MTLRERLRNVRKSDMEVLAIEDQIQAIRDTLERVSPILSDMPSAHGNNDKMIDGIAKMLDLKDKLNQKIDEVCGEKKEVIDIIYSISDGNYRKLLFERYINYKTFERIADEMNYSYPHICRLHGHALQQIDSLEKML